MKTLLALCFLVIGFTAVSVTPAQADETYHHHRHHHHHHHHHHHDQ